MKVKSQNNKITLKKKQPTLVIGCGGMGQDVLKSLYQKYMTTHDNQYHFFKEILPVELLAIDTLIEQESGEPMLADSDFLSLGPLQLDRFLYKDYVNEPLIKEWLNPNHYAGLMSTGAMQIRAFGRLAFFLKSTQVADIIDKKLRSITSEKHKYSDTDKSRNTLFQHGGDVVVHIIGSVAGGTGSGIMLDLAYLIRSISHISPVITAHLIMPDIIPDRQIKESIEANSYAFLKELDNFNLSPKIYTQNSPISKYLNFKNKLQEQSWLENFENEPSLMLPPFDYVNILSAHSKDNSTVTKTEMIDLISEKIFQCHMNSIGKKEYERTVNIRTDVLGQKYTGDKIKEGKPCSYSSYGISLFKVHENLIQHKIKNLIIDELDSFFTKNIQSIHAIHIISTDKKYEELEKEAGITNLKPPEPGTDANKAEKEVTEWWEKISKQIDEVIEEKRISEFLFFKFMEHNQGICDVKVDIPLPEIDKRIKNASDIGTTFSDRSDFLDTKKIIGTLISNIKYNFLEKFKGECDQIIRKVIPQHYERMRNTIINLKDLKNLEKKLDNALFYDFPFKSLNKYIHEGFSKENNTVYIEIDYYQLYKAIRKDDIKAIDEEILKICHQIIKDFIKSKAHNVEEQKISVETFLKALFDEDNVINHKLLEDRLNSIVKLASPRWCYSDHYEKYVQTIYLIGCSNKNYVYDKIKDCYSSTLEATNQEDYPETIPIIISQHGLPLIGYNQLENYKKSYINMKEKYSSSLNTTFFRQFHLDKRWEEKDRSDLVDPFEDVPESCIKHINGQLFSFLWFNGGIEIKGERYFYQKSDFELNEEDICGAYHSSSIKDSFDKFCVLIDQKRELENLIKKSTYEKQADIDKDFKERLTDFRKKTLEKEKKQIYEKYKKNKTQKAEKNYECICFMIKYIDLFIDNKEFLSEMDIRQIKDYIEKMEQESKKIRSELEKSKSNDHRNSLLNKPSDDSQ